MKPANTNALPKHRGSCHCGAVTFEVALDLGQGATRCNCTICTKMGATGRNIAPDGFTLLTGEADLASYQWGAKIGTRYFCKHCGVHCFARGDLPELGGAFVSVNCNCLDDVDVADLKIGYWDGRHNNWAAGMRDTPWPIHAQSAGNEGLLTLPALM